MRLCSAQAKLASRCTHELSTMPAHDFATFACAVACARLVSDPSGSPLLRLDSSPEELRSNARHIRSGFAPRTDG